MGHFSPARKKRVEYLEKPDRRCGKKRPSTTPTRQRQVSKGRGELKGEKGGGGGSLKGENSSNGASRRNETRRNASSGYGHRKSKKAIHDFRHHFDSKMKQKSRLRMKLSVIISWEEEESL